MRAARTVCESKTWKIFEGSFCLFDKFLSKFFSVAKSPYSTKHFKFLKLFDCFTHIQYSNNFVKKEKNLPRGHLINFFAHLNSKNDFYYLNRPCWVQKCTLFYPNSLGKIFSLVTLIFYNFKKMFPPIKIFCTYFDMKNFMGY